MNFLKLLKQTQDIPDIAISRRNSFHLLGTSGKNLLKALIPTVGLAALSSPARAQQSTTPVDALNFILQLEYFGSEYYTLGIQSGVIPAEDLPFFQQILENENAHVTFLENLIQSLGGTPVSKLQFDFTAEGEYDPFNNYTDFLVLAQGTEETDVRTCKGQLQHVFSNKDALTAVAQLHSIEARQASALRRLRTSRGLDNLKSWISGNNRGTLPPASQKIYAGENNMIHAGIALQQNSDVPPWAIQEAFDEPFDNIQTLSVIGPFLIR